MLGKAEEMTEIHVLWTSSKIFSGRYFVSLRPRDSTGAAGGGGKERKLKGAHLSQSLERLRVRLDEFALADLGAFGRFGAHQVKEQLHVAQVGVPRDCYASAARRVSRRVRTIRQK